MATEFYILMILTLAIFSWHMSLHPIRTPNGNYILARSTQHAKAQFANNNNIPTELTLTFLKKGHARQPADSMLLHGQWSIGARPIVGDHIHMAISFWIHGQPRQQAEHDRPPIQDIQYEQPFGKDTNICNVPGDIAYQKIWPHAGVHTHCDGLIHVHPWSAPRTLRKEGLEVQLGLWFDQVGISYREYPTVSLQFPNGELYKSNQTHKWRIAEKRCFKHNIDNIYDSHLDSIWLGHAYASYIAWFDVNHAPPPNDIQTHIEHLKLVGADGAFGKPYPQTCA